MLNKNAKAWVAALRSGEFQQGIRCLHDASNLYCCLGVACDLYHRATGLLPVSFVARKQRYRYGFHTEILPHAVMKWLDLRCQNGQPNTGDSLVEMNDDRVSFHEIADFLESEPEGMFVT